MKEEKKYPTLKFRVKKNLYRLIEAGQFLRIEDGAEVWSKEKYRWSTEKGSEIEEYVSAGKLLSFKMYYYNVINPVTDEDKKEAMIAILNMHDSVNGKPLNVVQFFPYELNELIKQDAIEII